MGRVLCVREKYVNLHHFPVNSPYSPALEHSFLVYCNHLLYIIVLLNSNISKQGSIMHKLFQRILIIALVLTAFSSASFATSPIQIALFNPIQLQSEGESIVGARLNFIYGKNASLTGIDLGLVNHLTGPSTGIQWGLIGITEGSFTGLQDNTINIAKSSFTGIQSGFYSSAENMTGIQFSVINYAGSISGLQLGLLNIIGQGGAFPMMVLVNWGK